MSSRPSSPENDVFNLDIVPEKTNKAAGITTVDFGGLLPDPLRLHEDLKDGCGGQLWPAGMTLSKYMLTTHLNLGSKTVLEIGAGGGLVGLAVAKACRIDNASKVLITDQIPMLSLMRRNIALNDLDGRAEAAVYDWGDAIPTAITEWLQQALSRRNHPDIILAADCVYFEPAFPLLLRTLSDLIGPYTTCYFCFKKRRKADMRFIKDMHKKFQVEEIEYDDKTVDRRNSIFLYKLSAR